MSRGSCVELNTSCFIVRFAQSTGTHQLCSDNKLDYGRVRCFGHRAYSVNSTFDLNFRPRQRRYLKDL